MTPSSIGPMVRWARKRANLTQQALADAVEMPQSTIARIEAGMALLKATGYQLDS
jgi:transcriptional regulator with XRE-family HTH domain